MKTFKRLVVSIVSLSLTVSLTGCGIIREMMSILNGSYPEEVSTSEPTSYEKVETMIGKDGGVVKDEEENVTISIPQGALQEDTNISAQYIEEPSYLEANPSMNFLGAVEFGPSGTTFAKPVEVSLKLTDTPKNSNISIFCYSEAYQQWDFVTEASVSNKVATFNVNHFSKYKALDMTPSMLMKFHDLVKQAQATGQPDSWIHENFKNYLINEEHVMDIYSLYGGYWYEPCGLIIGGNYHINGKEGDPNQLTELIGETNLIGNTYGLCHDAELVIDVQTYKQIEGKPKEGQEIIAIGVGVYYKMIKPDIDLTASKKKLAKGESATINIRCHYVNATNYFDEFKDLDMDNYMLTIKRPSHFDIDKTSVLTNDGRASFIVTAKEENVAETITVNFDVSGDHGVHAEGNITLNSKGTFSGQIEQVLFFNYEIVTVPQAIGVSSQGSFRLTLTYDIDGTLTENEGSVSGIVNYTNIDATISSSPCVVYHKQSGETYAYDVFQSVTSKTPSTASFNVSGTKDPDGKCSLSASTNSAQLISIGGSGTAAAMGNFFFSIDIKCGAMVLLDIDLSLPSSENAMGYLKDSIDDGFFIGDGDHREPLNNNTIPLTVLNRSEETTQTITVG